MIDKELLAILACPVCRGGVIELPLNKHNFKPPAGVKEFQGRFEVGKGKLNKEENGKIVCAGCGRQYPVRGGIPIMLVEESQKKQGEPIE